MKRLARSPLALLFAVAALRSAGLAFGILNIDESDFTLFGVGLWKGIVPYRDLVDIKPPLAYVTYMPVYITGQLRIWPLRVFAVLWVFATAMVLRAAVRRWLRAREPHAGGLVDDAGWAAAWLYLLALLCEIPSFAGEVMLNLPAAGALLCLARASEGKNGRRWFIGLSGLCAALASLYKHQGAVVALAFGLALVAGPFLPLESARAGEPQPARAARIFGALLDGAVLALGFAIPWALALGLYAQLHELPSFIEWVFTRNLAYAGKGMAGSSLGRFAQSTLLCCGATLVPWLFALRASARSLRTGALWRDPFLLAGTLLLGLTWLAVSAGGRFYEHYYLQFAPPLALLGAREFAALARDFSSMKLRWKTALALGCALPVLGLTGYSWARGFAGNYPSQEPRAREVAAFIDSNSAPSETVFVWGHFSPIYLLAERFPGTRYETTSVHMGNFDPEHLPESFDAARFRSERDVQLTLLDLRDRQPALIVDTAPADIHDWHKIPLRAFPDLLAYINANYHLIGHPAGADVYRRN